MADTIDISVALSSIQDLPVLEHVEGNDLFAVAHETPDGWVTMKTSHSGVIRGLDETYNLENLCAIYDRLSSAVGVSGLMSADISNPYVISSIAFELGKPISVGGYRLSSMIRVEPLCSDARVPVAVMWFGEVSTTIDIPRPKDNLVTFVRWNLE